MPWRARTSLGGYVSVTVTKGAGAGVSDVTVKNTADTTAYPGKVAPVLWAVHDDATKVFEMSKPASSGLEHLAEDGNPADLATEVAAMSGVGSSGVDNTAMGASGPGPLSPGQSVQFSVTADAGHRFLSLAAMVAPSSDTFIGLDPGGIALLDASGNPRSDTDIANDIAAHLFAWDAGTERNQSGGAGPDQAGHQSAPDTGASEGDGTVRQLGDPVWGYPAPLDLVKVTIKPMP